MGPRAQATAPPLPPIPILDPMVERAEIQEDGKGFIMESTPDIVDIDEEDSSKKKKKKKKNKNGESAPSSPEKDATTRRELTEEEVQRVIEMRKQRDMILAQRQAIIDHTLYLINLGQDFISELLRRFNIIDAILPNLFHPLLSIRLEAAEILRLLITNVPIQFSTLVSNDSVCFFFLSPIFFIFLFV